VALVKLDNTHFQLQAPLLVDHVSKIVLYAQEAQLLSVTNVLQDILMLVLINALPVQIYVLNATVQLNVQFARLLLNNLI